MVPENQVHRSIMAKVPPEFTPVTSANAPVENVVGYIVSGVDLERHRDVLGHWLGDNFWLSVISDLQARGDENIFNACDESLISNARGSPHIVLFGEPECQGKIDDAHPELGT